MATAGFHNFSEVAHKEAPAHSEHMGLYPPEKWTETVLLSIMNDSMANQRNCWKPNPCETNYSNTQINDILKNGLELFDSKNDVKHGVEAIEAKHHSLEQHHSLDKHHSSDKHHTSDKEKWGADHPFRGQIDEIMQEIPKQSYKDAIAAFPELKGIPGVNAELLLKGIIRNELYHYDRNDFAEDGMATLLAMMGKNAMPNVAGHHGDSLTLGFSQRSLKGVLELEKEFPEQMKAFKGHELDALEDPKLAPLLVAAVLAHVMKMYHNNGIKPTLENVIYGYNPDVAAKNGKGHELLPTEETLKKSHHVANVIHHMHMAKKAEDKGNS